MRKKVILAVASACLLAASSWQSRAAITVDNLAHWETIGTETVDGTTWTINLGGTSLVGNNGLTESAANITVIFNSLGTLEIQQNTGVIDMSGTLGYSASITGARFTSVQLLSTGTGTYGITKTVNGVTLSVNNASPNSAIVAIPGAPSTINVSETVTVSGGGLVQNFDNNYTTVVPEPTTIVAGTLLLLPFGASTLRLRRKSGVA